MEEKGRKNNWWVLLMILFLVLFIFVSLWWSFGKKSMKTAATPVEVGRYVNCTANASDTAVAPEGWTSWLYSAPLKEESSARGTADSGRREFSLKEMVEKKGESVYYRLERTGFAQKDYVTGAKAVIEVCDENNQTSSFYSTTNDKLTPAGEKISAKIMHLHNNPKVFHSGNYRIDAFVNYDGTWKLINRIEGVRLGE